MSSGLLQGLLLAGLAYLIGSLSFAVLVSRAFGMADPRSYGSGNAGATNVLRTGKKAAALLTLLGDSLKGVVAVLGARALGASVDVQAVVALAVMLGHIWPVFFRFRGGKGVATAAGVLLALHWPLGLVTLGVWLAVAVSLRISSLAALLAAATAPLACYWLLPGQTTLFGMVLLMAALLVQRHKQNLLNLLAGKEGRIGEKSPQPGTDPDQDGAA